MTDPLDVLLDAGGSTEPDPFFRDRLMAEVRELLESVAAHAQSDPGTLRRDQPTAPVDAPTLSGFEVRSRSSKPPTPRRPVFGAFVTAAAAAVVVAGLIITNHRDPGPDPLSTVPQPSATTNATPSRPKLSDGDIAEASLLTTTEIGGGFVADMVGISGAMALDAETARIAPECATFLDSVFESDRRPATVRTRNFATTTERFTQYVVVFPTEVAAKSMMSAVGDPRFPACLVGYTRAESELGSAEDASFTLAVPHPLVDVGDQMVTLAMTASRTLDGVAMKLAGVIPIVRVGRAVVIFSPRVSFDEPNAAGYPERRLDQALALTVDKLRAAQDG